MATGTPLEDSRSLAQRYSRMRTEAETLVICSFKLFTIYNFIFWNVVSFLHNGFSSEVLLVFLWAKLLSYARYEKKHSSVDR